MKSMFVVDSLLVLASRALFKNGRDADEKHVFFSLSIDVSLGGNIGHDWDADEKYVFSRLSIDFSPGRNIRNDWDADEKHVLRRNLRRLFNDSNPTRDIRNDRDADEKHVFFADFPLISTSGALLETIQPLGR